jgi:myo-inositol-1(or 4)-monophosphatase
MSHDATQLKSRLDFALDISAQASELILRHFRSDDLQVHFKSDDSPVTRADRGAEQLLRAAITAEFPGDGILGEELGTTASENGYRWILDPIDGTKAFVHGVEQFGTLIGMQFQGCTELGVCRFPALDEVVYAATGQGTWQRVGAATPIRCCVSSTDRLSEALFCYTEMTSWSEIDAQDRFEQLCETVRVSRGWGDCYGHVMVATGRADLMIDPIMSPWDAAALLPIVQEAGGHFVGWNGRACIDAGNGISVNAFLKDAVFTVLDE